MENKELLKLAEDHGLFLKDEMLFNEMAIDFKVVFATDLDDTKDLVVGSGATSLNKPWNGMRQRP